MTPPNTPQENPQSSPRDAVLATVHTQIENMQIEIDETQRQNLLRILQEENLDVERLQKINELLIEAQRAYAENPTETLRIITEINAGDEDKVVSNEKDKKTRQKKQGSAPTEAMDKIGGFVEQVMKFIEGLQKQLGGVMGYGKLRSMAESSKDPLFKKIFEALKNTPEAKITEITKQLANNDLTLEDETTIDAVAKLIERQLKKLKEDEKLPLNYEFDDHISALMTKINKVGFVSVDDFATAGQEIYEKLPVLTPASTPAPAPQLATAPERTRTPVTGTTNTTVGVGDSTPMQVTRETDGVAFTMNGKKATLKTIDTQTITSVELLEPTPQFSASVVMTLADNTKREITASELKNIAFGTAKTVQVKNTTTNSDISLEMTFV